MTQLNNSAELNNLPESCKVEYEVDGQRVKLTQSIVQNYIVGNQANITPKEFKLFAELCQARKLNPFLREAYLIKYSDKQAAQMVVSKDVVLKRAVLHPRKRAQAKNQARRRKSEKYEIKSAKCAIGALQIPANF